MFQNPADTYSPRLASGMAPGFPATSRRGCGSWDDGMVRRTRKCAEETRDQLLDAAERLFYEHGVTRTSLEEIARAAGVTRGAVYWHFRNKIDLFEAMQERAERPAGEFMRRLATCETDAPLSALRDACCHAMRQLAADERRRRVYAIVAHRCEHIAEMAGALERKRTMKDQVIRRFAHIFEHARHLGAMSPALAPRVAAQCLYALILGLVTDWVERQEDYDLCRRGPACIDAFFRALGSGAATSPPDAAGSS